MILDCVVETEASLVICNAEHVFAIIAFHKETKRKLNQVKSNITAVILDTVCGVYTVCLCYFCVFVREPLLRGLILNRVLT